MLSLRVVLVLVALCGIVGPASPRQKPKQGVVQKLVSQRLPKLGHRNWVVVVDSAYPLQTSPGIETVTVDVPQTQAVREVLQALKKTRHVRPTVFVDRELAFVPEKHAKGISNYRTNLNKILKGAPVSRLPHEEIIAKLDEAGKTFNVLVVKTPLTLPYTSVFFQLECGYWSDTAEKALREAMQKGAK